MSRQKPDLRVNTSGFQMDPRVAGESEGDYRNRTRILEGNYARSQTDADTSGMAWNGDNFYDANFTPWYLDPRIMGPVAVGAASLGAGLFGGAPGVAPIAAQGGSGAGAGGGAAATAGGAGAGAGAGTTAAGGAAAMGTLDKIMKYLSNPFIASIAGGAINGIFGGEDPTGQKNPFTGQVDPQKMLEQSKGLITGSLSDAVRKSEKPTKLRSSYVQQPISYSGGGLPFEIGLSGSDPALGDPSLLEGQPGDHADLKLALKAIGINV